MKSLISTLTIDTGVVQGSLYAAKTHTVNFYIWKAEKGAICIDSGFDPIAVRHALKAVNINPSDIAHLFLTHSDIDHIGGMNLFPDAQIYLSADEEPMVRGQMTRMFGIYHNHRISRPYRLLHDGDMVTVDGLQIESVSSPGHTPGSMSYVINGSVLFSGDAFKLENGRAVPCPRYTMDIVKQSDSIRRLSQLHGIDLICTAHWGVSRDWDQAFLPQPI